MWKFLLMAIVSACKPMTATTATRAPVLLSYDEAQLYYDYYFHQHQGKLRLNYMQELEQDIEVSLAHNSEYSDAQKHSLRQMQHKVKSFITYGIRSGCLPQNDSGHYVENEQTKQRLCSVILTKMKELHYQHIDLSQTVHSADHSEQQLFSALLGIVTATVEKSLSTYQHMFPFAEVDVVRICKTKNNETVYVAIPFDQRDDYVTRNPDIAPPAYPVYRQQQQKNNHCQQLPALLSQETTVSAKKFTEAVQVQQLVQDYVNRLNAIIDRLDRLVHGADGDPAATKKENLFIFKVANTVDFDNDNVVNAYEAYTQILLAAAREGILPLLMLYYRDKLQLNIQGSWAGLKAMHYEPLAYPLSRKLEEVIVALHEQLIDQWLQLKEAEGKQRKDKKIYELLVNNDIAAARLIMQDPAYTASVTRLFNKYQEDKRAPKWLQLLKSWTYRMDMLFIPLTIAAGIVSGGAFLPLVATIAVSINFFWVGVTGAETHLARKRYAMMERALLSGNSTQVARGAKLLREFHNKRRSLVVAGAIGVPLSLPALKLALRGSEGLKTAAIDITAALSADFDGVIGGDELDLLGRYDDTSDAELLQQR